MTILIFIAIQGLIIGALARLALPGKDPMSIWATMGIGVLASFAAGLIVYLISDGEAAPSFLFSFVFAFAIMYLIRRKRGGGLTSPGERPL